VRSGYPPLNVERTFWIFYGVSGNVLGDISISCTILNAPASSHGVDSDSGWHHTACERRGRLPDVFAFTLWGECQQDLVTKKLPVVILFWDKVIGRVSIRVRQNFDQSLLSK
jgi:hypothetical protein